MSIVTRNVLPGLVAAVCSALNRDPCGGEWSDSKLWIVASVACLYEVFGSEGSSSYVRQSFKAFWFVLIGIHYDYCNTFISRFYYNRTII